MCMCASVFSCALFFTLPSQETINMSTETNMSELLSRFMSDVCRSAELLVVQPRRQRKRQQQESGGDRLDTGQLLRRRRARFTASAAAATASSTQKSVPIYVPNFAAHHQQRVRHTASDVTSSSLSHCVSLNVEMRLILAAHMGCYVLNGC